MIEISNNERILLLQGPMGSFFTRFAAFLRTNNAQVWKINFNGGDWLFYSGINTINYRDTMEAWPQFLASFLLESKITKIYLFGDCRYYHREAIKVAKSGEVEIYVFEEGYIRPDYITLERDGVNGNSSLSRDPDFYLSFPPPASEPSAHPAQTSFGRMAMSAMSYYLAGALLRPYFKNYEHHKSFSVIQKGFSWCRSGFRKALYTRRDAKLTDRLAKELSQRYFLIPLQVHNDAQVRFHSSHEDIEGFIEDVITSFAHHAPGDIYLVIKHHPMDRGGKHYGKLIRRISKKYSIGERVIYTHQIHLPTALDHARGVVVINSTVGLSALIHDTPVKTTGNAIYNMNGLTCQGSLESFWSDPGKISQSLLESFRTYVIERAQLNGSFYGRDPFPTPGKPQ